MDRRENTKEFSYIPNLDCIQLRNIIKEKKWSKLHTLLYGLEYERVGLDRAVMIIQDMKNRYGKYSGFNILDLGCNNGLFSYVLGACGNNLKGIDNGVIDIQERYKELKIRGNKDFTEVQLQKISVKEFVHNTEEKFDIILLLSLAHQWEFGYGGTGKEKIHKGEIRKILKDVFNKFHMGIYYECPFNEPGFEEGYGEKFLEEYLEDFHKYKMDLVGVTVGPNGYSRKLFRIERSC